MSEIDSCGLALTIQLEYLCSFSTKADFVNIELPNKNCPKYMSWKGKKSARIIWIICKLFVSFAGPVSLPSLISQGRQKHAMQISLLVIPDELDIGSTEASSECQASATM